MDWIKRLNEAVSYIENHLTDEIDYNEVAKIACCSTYHFQRMFAYMSNIPLSEYIRRRRMTLAAVDLQNSNEKILEIALKYGYTSPTAFNRAFRSVHNVAPSQLKKGEVQIKSYPPISFKITIKGVEGMEYRIKEKEAFRIVGVCEPMSNDIEKNFKTIPEMWNRIAKDGTIPRLVSMMNCEPKGILGVSAFEKEEEGKYYIAVSSDMPVDKTLEEYTIPACTWAIFSGEGPCPKAIQELEQRMITEWLPTSGYEYANGPDIEVYLNEDIQNAIFEVWVPVIKK